MRTRILFASSTIIGGCIWLLAPFVLSMYHFSQEIQYAQLFLIAPLFLAIGLIGYYREFASKYSLTGRVGIFLLALGVLGFVPFSTHRTLTTYTLPAFFPLAVIAVVGAVSAQVGMVGIAIDAWQTNVPSKRMALWLPLSLPATAAINYIGDTMLGLFHVGLHYYTGVSGLAWIGLGYLLWQSTEGTPSSMAENRIAQ